MKQSTPFGLLGLNQDILLAVEAAGFTQPSPIQQQAIPAVLEGHDVIAQAQTGTGKTAAFCLPALDKMKKTGTTLLIIVPTRELAQQVSEEFNRFGRQVDLKAVAIYGGQSISVQMKKVRAGAQAIVATPGRLLDFLRSKKLPQFAPSLVVLDEADEMLDMGFLEDIQRIFEFLPKKRQTLFFSATMPKPIKQLAEQILSKPVMIKTKPETKNQESIEQIHYLVRDGEREAALIRLIDSHSPVKAIVFCRTKKEVDGLSNYLLGQGHSVRPLHGDMEQKQRQDTIHAFKQGRCKLLIATDIAGRGLDVPDVSHVFNFHIPFTKEGHTHRIGRTGRAGRSGIAITLITPAEFNKAGRILNLKSHEMKLSPIPTLSEVKAGRHQKFVDQIKDRTIEEASKELYQQLEQTMKPEQIGIHLLSMLLENDKISGPEKIGLSPKEIEEFRIFRSHRGERRNKKKSSPKKYHRKKFAKR